MTTKNNTSLRRDRARMRIAAATKYFAKKAVTIDGQEMHAKDLVEIYQQALNTEDNVDQARATLKENIVARTAAAQKAARISTALEGIVGAAFGPTSKAFAEFGFRARRIAEKSAETKALAAEKLRATRAARHTMGSRQKAAVHGDVDASSQPVPPPPAPVAPPAAQPAVNNGSSGAVQSVLSLNGGSG